MKENNIEKRVFEIRMDGETESRTVAGYAAVFNKDSQDLGGFTERIASGAFAAALKVSDVRALFNHDPNHILARNTSGTLRLLEDENGLRYEFDAPNTTLGNDLLEMIRRGDVNQSSFGFTVEKDSWEERDGKVYRTIKQVKRLYDVSPVTYPAYPDATVAVRSMQESMKKEEETPEDNLGELRDIIAKAALGI
jgi:HK97 family phage prohead protease